MLGRQPLQLLPLLCVSPALALLPLHTLPLHTLPLHTLPLHAASTCSQHLRPPAPPAPPQQLSQAQGRAGLGTQQYGAVNGLGRPGMLNPALAQQQQQQQQLRQAAGAGAVGGLTGAPGAPGAGRWVLRPPG